MLKRTPEFDKRLNSDLRNLISPFQYRIVGSYSVLENGLPITDIDVTVELNLNLNTINAIIKKLETSASFYFMRVNCGYYSQFTPPWKIDDQGGCSFRLNKAREWAKILELPSHKKRRIIEILNDETISLADLLTIEKMIHPECEIIWSLDELKSGRKIVNGKEYSIFDVAKTETPVIEAVYIFNNQVCAIDIGLFDKRTGSKPQSIHNFYSQAWYKIMKSYRWKIRDEERPEYLKLMNTFVHDIALIYRLHLLETLKEGIVPIHLREKHASIIASLRLATSGVLMSSTALQQRIDAKLSKYIDVYFKKLKEKEVFDFLIYTKRGIEAQVRVPTRIIEHREKLGYECPFFRTSINEFRRLVELSIRTLIPPEKLIECFIQISDEKKMEINTFILYFGKNNLQLRKNGDKFILYENQTQIGEDSNPEAFQRKILMS